MDPHIQEWLNLALRWFHVITGVAWIGASFYFNWLENQIDRHGKHLRDGIAGDLWAIHGGGFYFLEKYKGAPATIPDKLHWFKWEAYFTWISGFSLLVVAYYLKPETMLIDPSVRDLVPWEAIGIGLMVLVVGWVVYDLMCKSPLVKKPVLFTSLSIGLAIGAAFFLCHTLGARAAYIHMGAMLGTIMAANVFFVIIPSQRALVDAAIKGEALNPQLGINAGLRSRHNNYITLPVLFIMVSNHYPSTFGHTFNWLVLGGIALVGASIRHYFNIRHLPEKKVWILPIAAAGYLALAWWTYPQQQVTSMDSQAAISPMRVAKIFAERCVTCHSKAPTDDEYKTAPNGVMLDSFSQIKALSDSIKIRVVDTTIMPLGNKSQMTVEERQVIGAWISAGMPIE
jgi:uncharacterized membrane protein